MLRQDLWLTDHHPTLTCTTGGGTGQGGLTASRLDVQQMHREKKGAKVSWPIPPKHWRKCMGIEPTNPLLFAPEF
jgi:hypothetical protein